MNQTQDTINNASTNEHKEANKASGSIAAKHDLSNEYNHLAVEQQAQKFWQSKNAYQATEKDIDNNQDKFYCLSMFPYPSGRLHMGHVRNYTLSDVVARVARMQGKNVLHPMGWDAFGLPAENAAIQHQVHPGDWTEHNIANMKQQLDRLGLGFDWSREIATCHPSYYKWEQWLFIQMFNQGLVYKKETTVNWDPIDQTVLANEQVIDGKGWRSGAQVEKRSIPQWFLKITDYADELLDDLEGLDQWPEQVKTMQANWIGRSSGANLTFQLDGETAQEVAADLHAIEVYTTRIDTLCGATFLAIAPQHPLALLAAQDNAHLAEFIQRCSTMKTAEADMATMDKEGFATSFTVTNPLTHKSMPIWVANYVLMDYGSGAVMCVPAHDQRDWEFASLYKLHIVPVVKPLATNDQVLDWNFDQAAFAERGQVINSGTYDGLSSHEAQVQITQALEAQGIAKACKQYRLRDWGISRQRSWGAPIPMIHCAACGDLPVPETDLPVSLPKDLEFTGKGGSPLSHHKQFMATTCPQCDKPAQRESDTFDTFMESSWYFARYACPSEDQHILNEKSNYWLPVDQYVGGIEHAILHLLYARFLHKVIRDLGFVKSNEPFTRLLCQGMVLSETFYTLKESGEKIFHNIRDLQLEKDQKGQVIQATLKTTGEPVVASGLEKMSKSKNNGADPEELVAIYGADTLRLFSMFAAPPEQTLEWNESGVEGAHRFLKRVWRLVEQHISSSHHQQALAIDMTTFNYAHLTSQQKELRMQIHTALKKVTDDYTRRQNFNTAVAALMKLVNQISSFEDNTINGAVVLQEGLCILVQMLSPIAPHICHTLWLQLLGLAETEITHLAQTPLEHPWPQTDEKALVQDEMTIVVQVNGKKRAELQLSVDLDVAVIKQLAQSSPAVAAFIDNKTIHKLIYVPGKLVNIVAR